MSEEEVVMSSLQRRAIEVAVVLLALWMAAGLLFGIASTLLHVLLFIAGWMISVLTHPLVFIVGVVIIFIVVRALARRIQHGNYTFTGEKNDRTAY